VLRLFCESKEVKIPLEQQERLSMLVTGQSRSGKTFFASLYGQWLIKQGQAVHLIDLGQKWSNQDKDRLYEAGVFLGLMEDRKIILPFSTSTDLLGCARIILNSLGLWAVQTEALIKSILKKLVESDATFTLETFLVELEIRAVESENAAEVYGRLLGFRQVPKVVFVLHWPRARHITDESKIWELDDMDSIYVQLTAQLILYCLLCSKKRKSKLGNNRKKLFVFLDEFQTLDIDQKSILGICLTEGQKYKLYLVLITQYLQGKFSDAVLNQLYQGGYRIYFRLTESEADTVSRQLTVNTEQRKFLRKTLQDLPRGKCLFLGPHTIGKQTEISELVRFVTVHDVSSDFDSNKHAKDVIIVKEAMNKGRNGAIHPRNVGVSVSRRV